MVLEKVYDELISMIEDLRKQISGGVGSSVDYNTEIENLPKVNNITLKGNKKSSDLKIAYSMTETEYAAATKNAESIYCLQENAGTVTETEDFTSISWEQSGDDYIATVSYTPSNQNVTGVTSVTCDSDTITIESFSLVDGAVVSLISTTDPAEVPESVEFTFIMSQPIGATRIVKDGIEFGGYSDVYSTDEKVVGKWIDGRPLYRKTYSAGALPNNTQKDIVTLTDEEVKRMYGIAIDTTEGSIDCRPLPMADAGSISNNIRIDVTNNILNIKTGASWSSYVGFVTIEYTKTNG